MKNPSPTLIGIVGIYLSFCLPTSHAASGNKGNHPHRISVTISPTASSLQAGQSQQFAATVSGTSNTAVNWLVNGGIGGNSAVGTISPAGIYSAPAAAPSSLVTVTAQSAYQSTASASAAVSITPPATVSISISISPVSSTLQVNGSQQFAAAVSGTTYTAVSWSVSGVLGGNSLVGTISSSGLYTAPASAPTGPVTVTAQSTYDPNSSASAPVMITAPVAHDVNLSWIASSSPVAGYNIYRGNQSSGPFARINSLLDTATVYTDGSVVSGQMYYYVTTAVDSTGAESGYSNLAQALIP